MHPLEAKLAAAWPPSDWADVTVVAAVSGGCDSVALLRAMTALKTDGDGRLCVAHLNHHLRPDADRDERFVVELCSRLGVACQVGHATVRDQGDGLEAAARLARYEFLEQTAARLGARLVATAHTADDQAETILHRIVRGTGLRGLSGMTRARPLGHATLLRPLLGIRRDELAVYLDALGQPYCRDSSNTDRRFTRNRLRLEAMPMLREQFNPHLTDALLRLGALAAESQQTIDRQANHWLDRCTTFDLGDEVRLAVSPLIDQPPLVVREVFRAIWRRQHWPLQAMGRRQWDELARMADSPDPVKRIFPGNIAVERVADELRLRPQCASQ
ncbi:MAG: tRNA lysidine(34) synthetase TilS [Planctomycetaceae bacterium]|nr:tRNA lysidine(34) synthetase TilS [Planctomycetaceae bacterium]